MYPRLVQTRATPFLAIIAFVSVMAVAGCDLLTHGNPGPDDLFWTATINGEEWVGDSVSGAISDMSGVDLLQVSSTRYPSDQYPYADKMSINVDYDHDTSTYDLAWRLTHHVGGQWGNGALYHMISGGDVIVGDYFAISSERNELVLTSYDKLTGLAEGSFEVTLVVHPELVGHLPTPDTLRVTDGRFRAFVEDYRDR